MTSALNPPVRPSVLRPGWRFLLAHPAHFIALGCGSGLSPFAPGTMGTVFGWLSYLLLAQWLDAWQMGGLIAVSTLGGWWACTVAAQRMHVLDPGPIVWDEVVAFWIILWLAMPMGFLGQLVAFVLFRALDVLKPGPIGWADDLFHGFGWKGGLGIMLDDLVGAFCTVFVIALWRFYA
ncbi:MAG TPA: phosphatidylglycerophosphatase A [Ramlibacter sp.]|nr:phosphatidylglycerophosphatase A [Ramlibacter sp.]